MKLITLLLIAKFARLCLGLRLSPSGKQPEFVELKYEACKGKKKIDVMDPSSLCFVDPNLPKKGLLLFAYSSDDQWKKQINELITFMRGFQQTTQTEHVPIALVSNAPLDLLQGLTNESLIIDYLIRPLPETLVPGKHRNYKYNPQWWTRLFHFGASPFKVTLTMDSNAAVCGDLKDIFASIEGYDFLAKNQAHWNCDAFHAHNFAMAASKSPHTDRLFRNWASEQKTHGVNVDDQHTLTYAISRTSDARVGVMKPRFATAFIHLNGTRAVPAITPVLTGGDIKIIHGGMSCQDVHRSGDRTRILGKDEEGQIFEAFSLKECHHFLGGNGFCGNRNCVHHEDFSKQKTYCSDEYVCPYERGGALKNYREREDDPDDAELVQF